MPTPRSGSSGRCGPPAISCFLKDSTTSAFNKDKEQIHAPSSSRFAIEVLSELAAMQHQFSEFKMEQKQLRESIVSLCASIPKSRNLQEGNSTDQPEFEASPHPSKTSAFLHAAEKEVKPCASGISMEEKEIQPCKSRMSAQFAAIEQMNAKNKEGLKRVLQYRAGEALNKRRVEPGDLRFGVLKTTLDLWIDSIMGFIVAVNAIMIGVQMDFDEVSPLFFGVTDKFFLITFCIELILKLSIHGLRYHFCGPHKRAHFLDFVIILVDITQQLMAAGTDTNSKNLSPFFRLVRIIKLMRLVRLLRSDVFRDLLAMVQGFSGSMSTLCWSMVLFFFVIYVYALIFRELFGRRDDIVQINPYFNTVPRSMLTMFRCGFGDCSSDYGPILEDVMVYYSWVHILLYCLFTFSVCVGVFNVISAIFVESILSATLRTEAAKKKARLSDEEMWCKNVEAIIMDLVNRSSYPWPTEGADVVDQLVSYELPLELLNQAVMEPIVAECLLALDLDPDDNAYLSDIMDPDNGGTINILDLVEALRRLRGDPRRSDIVSVDLMIRSIQKELRGLKATCEDMALHISNRSP